MGDEDSQVSVGADVVLEKSMEARQLLGRWLFIHRQLTAAAEVLFAALAAYDKVDLVHWYRNSVIILSDEMRVFDAFGTWHIRIASFMILRRR